MRRLSFRREDGMSMTEFALILPIFMVIVAGILGFGASSSTGSRQTTSRTRRPAGSCRVTTLGGLCPTGTPPARTVARPSAARSEQLIVEFNEGADQASVCIALEGTRQAGEPLKVTVAKPFTFVPILNIGLSPFSVVDHAHRAPRRRGHLEDPPAAIPTAYTEGCGT